jgi:hypothetical protein
VAVADRKRTIVRVETRSLSVIRPAQSAVDFWCEECSAVVAMVTPERAAELAGATPREIYRRIENGELHFAESEGGLLLVCLDSFKSPPDT